MRCAILFYNVYKYLRYALSLTLISINLFVNRFIYLFDKYESLMEINEILTEINVED